jgi:hypothetical protein
MAFLDADRFDPPGALDPYRNEVLGLLLSALLPLAAVFAIAGLVAFLGLAGVAPHYADPVLALFFVPLFPLWGAAHWFAAREGEAGHAAANWVQALIALGLVYPFLYGTLDAFWLGWANILWLILTGAAALRLARVSRPALLLVLPSLAWVALAAIPGYVLLTSGWSPGFAVTVAALGESASD